MESLVLLARAGKSTESCSRGLPLLGRTPFSAELVVGGFRRGLEGTEEEPLRLTGLSIGGNESGALVLLLREVPTCVADEKSDFEPQLSSRRGLLGLASRLWLALLSGAFL